jgi:hypothetical protein
MLFMLTPPIFVLSCLYQDLRRMSGNATRTCFGAPFLFSLPCPEAQALHLSAHVLSNQAGDDNVALGILASSRQKHKYYIFFNILLNDIASMEAELFSFG